jgi:hypothetical protein
MARSTAARIWLTDRLYALSAALRWTPGCFLAGLMISGALVAFVAGATFRNGHLVERPTDVVAA